MMSFKLVSGNTALASGHSDALLLPGGGSIPVRMSDEPLASVVDAVLVRSNDELEVLARLQQYPHVYDLLEGKRLLSFLSQRKAQMQAWLKEGIYIFGAYKVGTYIAREARQVGVNINGFIDNDLSKRGTTFDGAEVFAPDDIDCRDKTIVIASGRYSNQIIDQLGEACGKVLNMSEFLYAADAGHGPEKLFSSVVHQPIEEPYRYISTFLRLLDETSRQVFNGLIGMRTTLSIKSAQQTKSPFQDEYFDKDLVSAEASRHFVDAGAFTGDTLASLERHFGPVTQAYLFEPELPPYYEALKRFADRENVLVFNMGLDAQPSRFAYDPVLSCNVTNEIDGPVSPNVVSYIQGVPLDNLVQGKVGLFKLDIEGMEERALLGAQTMIKREKPVLAVCAYHRADDYWKLIDTVAAIRSDYRISLRHYADILHDITLYFH
jgi:FkbM family methyltransferase